MEETLEHQLAGLLKRLSISTEQKSSLENRLRQDGLSSELLKDVETSIRQAIIDNKAALEKEVEQADRQLAEISQRLDRELGNIQKMMEQAELDEVRKQIQG